MDGDVHFPLLPAGTIIHGQVERPLGAGQDRIPLVWTDALTPRPRQMRIPLGPSPAADAMGQMGAPGDYNDHLWRKLKATLAVTLIQTAGQAAVAAATSGNGNTYIGAGAFGNMTSTLPQLAFASDLNIPASVDRGPATVLTVYFPRYVNLIHFYGPRAVVEGAGR